MDVSSSMQEAKDLKLCLDQNFGEGESRICSLPDSILHHILSFLEMKDAVKTSILSKRWEFLWTSIPKLVFNGGWKLSDEKSEKFMNFVERVLLLRDSSDIHTLSIRCGVAANGPLTRINSWIVAALRHKMQKMVLNIYFNSYYGSFMLPRHLFACESLKELEVDFSCDLWLPSSVYFPNLKILTLSKVIFTDDSSVNQLFSSCPKLEKLVLIGCKWDNVKVVYVSTPMLEHLKISEGDEDEDEDKVEVEDEDEDEDEDAEPHCCQFMISGQRLKVFHYAGELKNEYCISEAPSLVDAHVDVYSRWIPEEKQDANRAHKLLWGLAHVKDLHISAGAFTVLNAAEELIPCLPLFLNLNHLEVFPCSFDFNCRALLKILYNSPYLKSICFAAGMYLSDGQQLDPVPPCFLTHLKRIKFKKFLGGDSLLALRINALKIMIKSARVLESIELGTKENNAKLNLLEECLKSNIVFRRNSS